MKARAAQAVVLFAVLASSSCIRRLGMVEAISSGESFSRTYFLLPGNHGVSKEDLVFRDISRHVHGVLQGLGYRPAATMQEAGLLVMVLYGVSDPMTQQEQMTIPVTQYVPGKSYTVNATTNSTAAAYGTGGYASGSGTATTRGTITESGRNETTYQSYAYTTTTYVSFIDLRAFDADEVRRAAATNAKAQSLGPVWTTAVFGADHTGDLRRQIPGLLEAAGPYIGTTTPGRVKLNIPENDGSKSKALVAPERPTARTAPPPETLPRVPPPVTPPPGPPSTIAQWQHRAVQFRAMKMDPDYATGFLLSPELAACRCSIANGIGAAARMLSRLEEDPDTERMATAARARGASGTDFEAALDELLYQSSEEEKAEACAVCQVDAFSKWRSRRVE